MLKGIDPIISPELLKILCEMGHGDEIVIADANFPGVTCAKRLIRADGHGGEKILEAVLTLFPLDRVADKNAFLMAVSEKNIPTPPNIGVAFLWICLFPSSLLGISTAPT